MKFRQPKKLQGLKIISLGGFGSVTSNMFIYETENDILLVDCGTGFPTGEMFGVDLIIPDISYLLEPGRREKIRGLILTHGHDDHIGALPYILPQLPPIPIYASRWATALIEEKLKEFRIGIRVQKVGEGSKVVLGNFSLEFIEVPHSIPETMHVVITTPLGTFYHAADFKLDLKPVMGHPANQGLISQISKKGVLCLLSDSLNAEKSGFTPSESKLEEVFEREIEDCKGKFFMTTMSSNISRFKQAIDVSIRHNRKIILFGRSVEKNIELALKLNYLNYPRNIFVSPKEVGKMPSSSLTLLVAGSQAQAGSALERIVAGERNVKIEVGDKVVFSTDAIPGNEVALYSLIDNILRLGAEVSYTDVSSDLHVSGHGRAEDLKKLIELVRPKYLLPIGGNYRHMIAYQKLATRLGYSKESILLPDENNVVEFLPTGQVDLSHSILPKLVMVDALGVGDVGNVVLRDRQVLATEGIVVIIVQIEHGTFRVMDEPDILTRGFVYVRESESLLNDAKQEIKKIIKKQKWKEIRFLRRGLQETLEKFFFARTGRHPMVLTMVIEV